NTFLPAMVTATFTVEVQPFRGPAAANCTNCANSIRVICAIRDSDLSDELSNQLEFESEEFAHRAVVEPHFVAVDEIAKRFKHLNNNSFFAVIRSWRNDSDLVVELDWRTVFR